MSTLLGFDAILVPPGSTIASAMSTLETSFTSRGWQVVGRHLPWIVCTATYGGVAQAQNFATGAFNGSESTLVSASNNWNQHPTQANITLPAIFTVQLSTNESITSYELVTGTYNTGYLAAGPKDWKLQSSADGVTWSDVDTQTNAPIGYSFEKKRYTVAGTPTARPYWRINITAHWAAVPQVHIRLFTSNGAMITDRTAIIVRPPSSETIGDSTKEECVMLQAYGTSIHVSPIVRFKTTTPKIYLFKGMVAQAVTYGIGACGPNNATSFSTTGSISAAGVMTVTATSGVIYPGMRVTGTGIPDGTFVFNQATGTTGSTGTYNLMSNYAYLGTAASMPMNAVSSQTNTISGTSISITGTALTSINDNTRALFTAIRNSSDANFTDYDWYYSKPSPQNNNDSNEWIVAVQKVPSIGNTSILNSINSNVYSYILAHPSLDGFQFLEYSYGAMHSMSTSEFAVAMDVSAGFIYYLQLNSRGGALATKTSTACYGPVHFVYADHTKAVASMPGSINSKLVSPTELIVGYDSASSDIASYFVPAKGFIISNAMNAAAGLGYSVSWNPSNPSNTYAAVNGIYWMRDIFIDGVYGPSMWGGTFTTTTTAPATKLVASGIFTLASGSSDALADDFQIHRQTTNGNTDVAYSTAGTQLIVPQLDFQDWYKFRGTATNEALALVPDTGITTTLNQIMDASTAYTTLTLTSTTGFATSGYVVIENELLQYTGISGATLTGVTRAKFGTTMQAHWVGDITYQGQWFTIINGGALYCGYTKPA